MNVDRISNTFLLNFSFIIRNKRKAFAIAVNWSSNGPCQVEFLFLAIFCHFNIIVEPASMLFWFPILFKLTPWILLSIVLHFISFGHLLTSDDWSFPNIILFFDIRTIETSHLMAVHTLMELVLVLKPTDSSTAGTFFVADNHFDHVDVF